MNSPFIVYKKDSVNFEEVIVYAVRDDNKGYPHFLIYEDEQWKYVSAKHFVAYF